MTPIWRVELSAAARADFEEIVRWTNPQFGASQAVAYGGLIRDALDRLGAGPEIVGATRRDEIGSGYRTLHIARNRRRGRYFVLFRVVAEADLPLIAVVRILHDAMDPLRHLPPDNET